MDVPPWMRAGDGGWPRGPRGMRGDAIAAGPDEHWPTGVRRGRGRANPWPGGPTAPWAGWSPGDGRRVTRATPTLEGAFRSWMPASRAADMAASMTWRAPDDSRRRADQVDGGLEEVLRLLGHGTIGRHATVQLQAGEPELLERAGEVVDGPWEVDGWRDAIVRFADCVVLVERRSDRTGVATCLAKVRAGRTLGTRGEMVRAGGEAWVDDEAMAAWVRAADLDDAADARIRAKVEDAMAAERRGVRVMTVGRGHEPGDDHSATVHVGDDVVRSRLVALGLLAAWMEGPSTGRKHDGVGPRRFESSWARERRIIMVDGAGTGSTAMTLARMVPARHRTTAWLVAAERGDLADRFAAGWEAADRA